MTSDKIRHIYQSISTSIEEASVMIEAVADALDDNPEFQEQVKEIFAKYRSLWLPIVGELTNEVTKARKTAFVEYRDMGLNDEQAIKMVCGR